MERIESIVISESEPLRTSLWLKDHKLWFFDGEWKPILGAYDIAENEGLLKIKELLLGDRKLFGEDSVDIEKIVKSFTDIINLQAPILDLYPISGKEGLIEVAKQDLIIKSLFPSLYNKIIFSLDNTEKSLELNRRMIEYINSIVNNPQEAYIPVYIVGNNISSIPAIYYNAHLYTTIDSKFKIYNIDTNDTTNGYISEIKSIDLTLLPTYIDLELGNTAQIKAYNLEQLQKVTGTQFFVHADFGIGVGSFNSGYGGETTIQTAGGDRVHYLITPDGECRKQEDRFEHSELFFNIGPIDVTTLPKTLIIDNPININKFKKATNLAFEANNGGVFIDDISMNQVSVNLLTKERIYTSPDIIYMEDQDWNYIKAIATTDSSQISLYLEKV